MGRNRYTIFNVTGAPYEKFQAFFNCNHIIYANYYVALKSNMAPVAQGRHELLTN